MLRMWRGVSNMTRKKTFGRIFRSRAGKLGRYVYEKGKRVAFQQLWEIEMGAALRLGHYKKAKGMVTQALKDGWITPMEAEIIRAQIIITEKTGRLLS